MSDTSIQFSNDDDRITVDEVIQALVYVRDHVLTNENFNTVKSIITNFKKLVSRIYDKIEDIDDDYSQKIDQDDLISRTIDMFYEDESVINFALMNTDDTTNDDIVKTSYANEIVSFINFVKSCFQTGDDILDDILKIIQSFTVVQDYDEDSRTLEIHKLGLQDIYTSIRQ